MSSSSIWRKEFFEGSLAHAASRSWTWYRAEFFALFPPQILAFLLDRGDRRLVLHTNRATKSLLLDSVEREALAAPISVDELLASSLDEALARRGATRASTKIVAEIPRDAFFRRRFDIPLAAQANLPRLLAAEIERKTPFAVTDVLHGHVAAPNPASPDKVGVEQWILRRDLLPSAIDGSGLSVADIDAVRPEWPEDAATPAPTLFIGRETETPQREGKAALALGLLAAALFLFGFAATVWRQEQTAAALDANIADVSDRAANVRRIADHAAAESRLLATLREERGKYPAFADLWEEISRVLPDGAYVTELRLSEAREGERLVDLVGFSDSAVSLPALFDRSPLFADARLTAPITPDPVEKREGFSLQAKVRRNP